MLISEFRSKYPDLDVYSFRTQENRQCFTVVEPSGRFKLSFIRARRALAVDAAAEQMKRINNRVPEDVFPFVYYDAMGFMRAA